MKRPNIILYLFFGLIAKCIAIIKGQKLTKKHKIKEPTIVISNHTSFYDFIYTTAAIYPKRITYLAAGKMFYEPINGFLLRLARAIPKSLMQTDLQATLKAFKVLKEGGIVSIFPEGQISPTGTSLMPSYAIAKFIKRSNANLYMIKHKGAYQVNPPWSKKSFKGKIETEVVKLLDKSAIEQLSLDEIYETVCKSLYFSSSSFTKTNNYHYHLNNISNLENVIYQCRNCFYEGLLAKRYYLECPNCLSQFHYDSKGLLNGQGIDELFEEQANQVKKESDLNSNYELVAEVTLMSFRNQRLKKVGTGTLTLKRFIYTYKGFVDGENTILEFKVSSTPTLPSDIGRNVQIYENDQIYQFEMSDPKLPTKFVHASEYLYSIHKGQ
jgi:1-acyl-sn-glycerol-3-phosphate acyltransferase